MKRIYYERFLAQCQGMTPAEIIKDLEARGERVERARSRRAGQNQTKPPTRKRDSTILTGWKKIVAYIGVSVAEAQEYRTRKKSENRLPVIQPGGKGRTVLSVKHILDEWKKREDKRKALPEATRKPENKR